ncbi:MAG TPA: hypothetical protein P5181_09790 [Dermatophilaceae bacterium]|nr:hypothetical protein [Dermatophilaceae bacterium]
MSQATALTGPARVAGLRPDPRARTTRRGGLRVVPAAIEHSRTGVFAGACIALLVAGLVTLLLLHTQLTQGAYTLHDLESRTGLLADQQHALTQALDAERNPTVLAQKAVAQGMVPAGSMAFIRLSDGTIIGEAKPAKADKAVTIVVAPKPGG